jgi:hypothetical protein
VLGALLKKHFCCSSSINQFFAGSTLLVDANRILTEAVCNNSYRGGSCDGNEHHWPVFASFDNMCLKLELLRGIYAYGFEKPSAIQQKAIVPCTMCRDMIVQGGSSVSILSPIYNILKVKQELEKQQPMRLLLFNK